MVVRSIDKVDGHHISLALEIRDDSVLDFSATQRQQAFDILSKEQLWLLLLDQFDAMPVEHIPAIIDFPWPRQTETLARESERCDIAIRDSIVVYFADIAFYHRSIAPQPMGLAGIVVEVVRPYRMKPRLLQADIKSTCTGKQRNMRVYFVLIHFWFYKKPMQNRSASDTYLQKIGVKCAECTKNTRAHLSNARVCLRCFLLVAVSSTALRRIGDSLFCNNKKIGILFDADKVSIRIHCRHAGRAAAHAEIEDRIALVCVAFYKPLTQRHGFLCAVRCAFLLICGKGQNARRKSLSAVVAFCLVFEMKLNINF